MKPRKSIFNFKTITCSFLLLAGVVASAQQTTGDVTKQNDIDPGTTTTGGAVRVIDNKGTLSTYNHKMV